MVKIRGFVDLTEEAKNRRIAEVNEKAQAEYAEALEAGERERAERLERSKRRCSASPSLRPLLMLSKPKSTPAYRAAYKDVHSSAVSYESPGQAQEELERILQQAELTGDNLLARAAYHRVIDLGIESVVDTYLTTRPRENRAWEPYTQAHQEVSQSRDIGHLLERTLTKRAFSSVPQSPGLNA